MMARISQHLVEGVLFSVVVLSLIFWADILETLLK